MEVVNEIPTMKLKKCVIWTPASRKGCNLFLAAQPGVHVPLLNPTTRKEYPFKFQDWIVQCFIIAKLFIYYFYFFFFLLL